MLAAVYVGFVRLVGALFDLYELVIVARVVASWLDVSPYHPAMRLLVQVTEPLLAPLRRWVRPRGGLDFSPLLALVVVWVVRSVVMSLLQGLAGFAAFALRPTVHAR